MALEDSIDVLIQFLSPAYEETYQRVFDCFLKIRGMREHIYVPKKLDEIDLLFCLNKLKIRLFSNLQLND